MAMDGPAAFWTWSGRIGALLAVSACTRAAAPLPRCYRSEGSVLGRSPGSLSLAPAGISGRIRLDPPATAFLQDADGARLQGSWSGRHPDSVLLRARDDFVVVEMRLEAKADSLTGTATARSDAALQRDSSGRLVDFRRQWRMAAEAVPCTAHRPQDQDFPDR